MATYITVADQEEGPYVTLATAINAVIASGITHEDTGLVLVSSGQFFAEAITVNNASGDIIIRGMGEWPRTLSISATNSGGLQFDNFRLDILNSTGSGEIQFTGGRLDEGNLTNSPLITFDSTELHQLTVNGDDGDMYLHNVKCSGNGHNITVRGGNHVEIVSGNYSRLSNPKHKISVSGANSVKMDHLWGTAYYSDTPALMISGVASGLIMDHCSFADQYNRIMRIVDTSGDVNFSILASSGFTPIQFGGTAVVVASGSCFTNYDALGASFGTIDGQFITSDPSFVNINKMDLRINANSPCACAADYINDIFYTDPELATVEVNKESIKYYQTDDTIRAIPWPSSVYVVQNGKAIYLQSDPAYLDNMNVFYATQYNLTTNTKTVQSLTNEKGGNHPYPLDYELYDKVNYSNNKVEKWVKPFSMIDISEIVSTTVDTIVGGTVSGAYQNVGFARDHTATDLGTPYYWIGEANNQYLYQYDAVTNDIMNTYSMFPDVTASGYGSILIGDTYYKFENTIKNPYNEMRALVDYKDWLYVMVRRKADPSGQLAKGTDLHIYNKFEREPFKTPVSIISGIPNIIGNDTADMTVDDQGMLYIASSGNIGVYRQAYDYGLVSRTDGTVKTEITFREDYQGVDL